MKKIVSFFLTVALMLGCISTVFAADTVSAAADASEVQTGKTVKITYTLPTSADYEDALALGIKFTYDKSAFALKSITGLSAAWIAYDTTGFGSWLANDPLAGDNISGKAFVVEFAVKDDAAKQAYQIAAEFVEDENFDSDYDNFDLTAPSVTVTVVAAPCPHSHVNTLPAAEPTCTTEGKTEGKVCADCGTTLVAQNTIPALGHKYNGELMDNGDGTHSNKCTNTGCTEYGNATAHSGDWAGNAAQHWKECACGTKIETAAHSGGTATCTAKAKCAVCGKEYGELKAHTAAEAVKENEVAPTCTAKGSYDEVVYCKDCRTEMSRTTKEVAMVAHNFVENATAANLKTAATCTEQAVYFMSCSVCGAQSSDTFSAGEKAAHNYVMKSDADNHWNECSVCGDKADVTAHSGGTATCMKQAECSTCGKAYGEKNTANHEDLQTVGDKPATCTEAGETGTGKCNACGTVLEESSVIPALGHDEVIDKAVEPTCTKTGLTEGKHCARCEEVLTAQEVVKALGHTEVVDAAKDATCTETGLTEGKHCSVCEEVLTAQEVVKALGHSYGEWTETKAPTCTEKGEQVRTCDVCGATDRQDVDALGHKYEGEGTVVKAPTCTDDGVMTNVCVVCGETKEEAIPALGHDFKDGKCTVCGAADPNFKPADDTKPADNTKPADDTKPADTTKPDTGDTGIAVWATLLAVSALCGTAIVVKKRHA